MFYFGSSAASVSMGNQEASVSESTRAGNSWLYSGTGGGIQKLCNAL